MNNIGPIHRRGLTQRRRVSGAKSVNEYYENAMMAESVGDGDPCAAFRKALKAYGDAAGTARQVRLIEAVIRTSKGVCDVDDMLDRDTRHVLAGIVDRYCLFVAGSTAPAAPQTFRQARVVLQKMFF